MNTAINAHKWTTQAPKRRTAHPVVKPIRSARQLAVGEELRKVNEEGTYVWDMLSEAVLLGQRKTGARLLERAFALQERSYELQADLQAMAGNERVAA